MTEADRDKDTKSDRKDTTQSAVDWASSKTPLDKNDTLDLGRLPKDHPGHKDSKDRKRTDPDR